MSGDFVTGCVGTKKQVCIYWDNSTGSCVKATTDTISHTCPIGGDKDESWPSGIANAVCKTVDTAGANNSVVVEFAVKDGNADSCGTVAQYQVGDMTAECGWTGQHCVVGGGSATECLWKVTVPTCPPSSPSSPCDAITDPSSINRSCTCAPNAANTFCDCSCKCC